MRETRWQHKWRAPETCVAAAFARIVDGRLRRPPVALLSLCLCVSVACLRALGSPVALLSPLLTSGCRHFRGRNHQTQRASDDGVVLGEVQKLAPPGHLLLELLV